MKSFTFLGTAVLSLTLAAGPAHAGEEPPTESPTGPPTAGPPQPTVRVQASGREVGQTARITVKIGSRGYAQVPGRVRVVVKRADGEWRRVYRASLSGTDRSVTFKPRMTKAGRYLAVVRYSSSTIRAFVATKFRVRH